MLLKIFIPVASAILAVMLYCLIGELCARFILPLLFYVE